MSGFCTKRSMSRGDRDRGISYKVTLVPTSLTSKLRLSGRYKLQINRYGLDLFIDPCLKLFSWTFDDIKSFWTTCKQNKYGFYVGKRSQSGEGEFVFQFESKDAVADFQRIISTGIRTGFKDFLRPVSDQIDYKAVTNMYTPPTQNNIISKNNNKENNKNKSKQDMSWMLDRGVHSRYFISFTTPDKDSSIEASYPLAYVRGRRTRSLDEEPVSSIH